MRTKEYKFKEGFTIKLRKSPDGVVYAMGETHVCEVSVFDLYEGNQFVETYDTFDEAKRMGMKISSDNVQHEAPHDGDRLRNQKDK